jgi:hypothetical protein
MNSRTFTFACVLAALALAAAACQKQGPAQRAGEQIDKSVAKAGDKIDDAVDKLRK